MVSLTAPAFTATADRLDPLGRLVPRATAGGDRTGGLNAILGGAVHLLEREDFSGSPESTASSAPLALQDRLEVAAASVIGGATPSALAMLSGGPRLPSFHEQLPHHLGHPGVRAAIETHAVGVLLDGAPAVAVAEYVRERTAGLSFAQVRDAAEPLRSIAVQSELAVAAEAVPAFPTLPPGAGPGPVAAILRTGPVGQEGIPGLALLASTLAAFPLSEHGNALQNFLNNTNLPGGAGPLGNFLRSQVGNQFNSLTRALDRRLLVGARGAREAALALAAAFDRAQDFVYIETPALDHREHGPDDDRLDLLGRLIDRLSARRGLRVIICAPSRLGPGTPKKLQAIRDAELLTAIADLRAAAPDRIAMFSPGVGAGRALRLATTTVIVDDVFALAGTTHLWRRGLTFDSSLAAAMFDERLIDGRPLEVSTFRRQLIADRLGLPAQPRSRRSRRTGPRDPRARRDRAERRFRHPPEPAPLGHPDPRARRGADQHRHRYLEPGRIARRPRSRRAIRRARADRPRSCRNRRLVAFRAAWHWRPVLPQKMVRDAVACGPISHSRAAGCR